MHMIDNIEKIAALEDELIRAIRASDTVALDKLLHDDLLFVAPNGLTVTKQMDLESHRSGQMIVEKLNSAIEQIKVIDDTAIVTVVYDTKGTMLGNLIEGRFKYIRVWKLFKAEWKIIGGSSMMV